MKHIYLADLPDGGKVRPVVILTRDVALPFLKRVTVAPITSTRHGIRTEVTVDESNGLDHESVITCDNIQTIPKNLIGRRLGALSIGQEAHLTQAIRAAFDLL